MVEDSSPGRARKVTNSDIKDAIRLKSDPVATKEDLIEELPLTKRQLSNRLEQLENSNDIGTKEVGVSKVWWYTNPDNFGSYSLDSGATYIPIVDELDLPGQGTTVRHRRLTVNSVFAYLFYHRTASVKTLQQHAWTVAPPVQYDNKENLWNECVRPALKTVIFFQKSPDSDEWTLTKLGQNVRNRYDEWALWKNWEEYKTKTEKLILDYFWSRLANIMSESVFDTIRPEPDNLNRCHLCGPDLDLQLELRFGSDWHTTSSDLKLVFTMNNTEHENTIRENEEAIRKDLPIDAILDSKFRGKLTPKYLIIGSTSIELDSSLILTEHQELPVVDDEWIRDIPPQVYDVFTAYLNL